MTILREIAVAMAGVYALLLACDAMFGIGERRFDDAFAQFAPADAKRGKRYSSLTTFIR